MTTGAAFICLGPANKTNTPIDAAEVKVHIQSTSSPADATPNTSPFGYLEFDWIGQVPGFAALERKP
jgi:hypothetical protein